MGAVTLQYTYKDECFISDKSDLHGIVAVLVFACIDGILFFAAIGYSVREDSGVLFLLDLMASIITVGVAWSISVSIRHRRRPALERRRRALAEGTRYAGKIVYAGVKMESERISSDSVSAGDEKYKNMYRRVPNYWVEVAYFDPQSGQTKQAYGLRMVRSMEHLIGRSVDVYVRQVWEDCLGKYLPDPYIDTCALQ